MARTMDRFFGDNQEGILANRDKSILERIYTNRILDEEGARIMEEQDEVITKYKLNRTGLMKDSRRLRVRGLSGNAQMGMELSMIKYLRFQDILGRKKTILGTEEATKKRRKQYHLYNKIVFGGYNRIMNQLMFGFTDDVKAEIKEQAIKAGLIKVEL